LDSQQRAVPAEAEAELPPYVGIRIADVQMVSTAEQASAACAALLAADAIGFDTESKPTFTKGETSTGPHLIQFSTDHKAWLFQIGASTSAHTLEVLTAVLESALPLKIGFGLSDDVKRLHAKLAILPAHRRQAGRLPVQPADQFPRRPAPVSADDLDGRPPVGRLPARDRRLLLAQHPPVPVRRPQPPCRPPSWNADASWSRAATPP
jgi:hypothetical protein